MLGNSDDAPLTGGTVTVSDSTSLLVQLLQDKAKVPIQGMPRAIRYDLHAIEDEIIAPGTRKAIPLGIAIKVPQGTYG